MTRPEQPGLEEQNAEGDDAAEVDEPRAVQLDSVPPQRFANNSRVMSGADFDSFISARAPKKSTVLFYAGMPPNTPGLVNLQVALSKRGYIATRDITGVNRGVFGQRLKRACSDFQCMNEVTDRPRPASAAFNPKLDADGKVGPNFLAKLATAPHKSRLEETTSPGNTTIEELRAEHARTRGGSPSRTLTGDNEKA